jgi:protein-L-isoaspartate(D-aspartate) O-methyltransferase
MMVDSQVRPNKVSDRRILDAMLELPRENFVPAGARALAYADEDVPLGNGRALIEPMVIARMVQTADVQAGMRVLVVGAGSGYGAALLAACGGVVTALEEDAGLIALARGALAGISGVTLVSGPLAAGWPQGAPYDVVFVDGAGEEFPAALARQLVPGRGRFVGIQSGPGRTSTAVVGTSTGEALVLRPVFDCACPPIGAFRRAAGFVF